MLPFLAAGIVTEVHGSDVAVNAAGQWIGFPLAMTAIYMGRRH
jgi:hypothetical protein